MLMRPRISIWISIWIMLVRSRISIILTVSVTHEIVRTHLMSELTCFYNNPLPPPTLLPDLHDLYSSSDASSSSSSPSTVFPLSLLLGDDFSFYEFLLFAHCPAHYLELLGDRAEWQAVLCSPTQLRSYFTLLPAINHHFVSHFLCGELARNPDRISAFAILESRGSGGEKGGTSGGGGGDASSGEGGGSDMEKKSAEETNEVETSVRKRGRRRRSADEPDELGSDDLTQKMVNEVSIGLVRFCLHCSWVGGECVWSLGRHIFMFTIITGR